jgi:hypothetical protein
MEDGITDRAPGPDPWGGKPPWELPGACRLDADPHRAPLLEQLGWAANFAGFLAFVLWYLDGLILCLLIALLLGLATWALARHDLARMRRGLMDTRGADQTAEAGQLGLLAVCWSLPGSAAALWLFLA